MINQRLEVEAYLEGKPADSKGAYRICCLIAKYYLEQGLSPLEVREKIFAWASAQGLHLTCSVNKAIRQAAGDRKSLRGNIPIQISLQDAEEIRRRFDTKNCRLLALALLCCAKCEGDARGEFSVSLQALAQWTGIAAQNISQRHLPELIRYAYVLRVGGGGGFSWDRQVKSRCLRLRLLVPLDSFGPWALEDNDLLALYRQIF